MLPETLRCADGKHVLITTAELQWILTGVDLSSIKKRKRYKVTDRFPRLAIPAGFGGSPKTGWLVLQRRSQAMLCSSPMRLMPSSQISYWDTFRSTISKLRLFHLHLQLYSIEPHHHRSPLLPFLH